MLYVSNFMAGACISRVLSLDPVCQENFIPWTFTGNEFFTLDEDPKSVPEKQICHYCNTAYLELAEEVLFFDTAGSLTYEDVLNTPSLRYRHSKLLHNLVRKLKTGSGNKVPTHARVENASAMGG